MSNTFAPTGFQFIRNYLNGAPTYQTTKNAMAYNNPNTIGKGDVVLINSSGLVDIAAATDHPVFGVFDGVQYFDTALQKTIFSNSWTAPSTALSGSVMATVITDPYAVFSVQSGAAGLGPVTQANVGENANTVVVAPQSGTGLSNQYLNQATIATTNTFQFRIIGLGAGLLNDNTSANNYVEVIACPGNWTATAALGI